MARVGFEFRSFGICGGGNAQIYLCGHDITSVVTRVQIDAGVGQIPSITIDVLGLALAVEHEIDHVDVISTLLKRDGSLNVQAVSVTGKEREGPNA